MNAYVIRARRFMQDHPDFIQVVNRTDIPLHEMVQEVIRALGNGPAVAYYLGKNAEFAIEISKLPLADALTRIVNLSALLSTGNANVN